MTSDGSSADSLVADAASAAPSLVGAFGGNPAGRKPPPAPPPPPPPLRPAAAVRIAGNRGKWGGGGGRGTTPVVVFGAESPSAGVTVKSALSTSLTAASLAPSQASSRKKTPQKKGAAAASHTSQINPPAAVASLSAVLDQRPFPDLGAANDSAPPFVVAASASTGGVGKDAAMGKGAALPTALKSLPPVKNFSKERHTWNANEEIAAILIAFDRHAAWIEHEIRQRPVSGTMLLYSRKKGKYRKDGYCWKKRRDGKTTREDHMKLKVGGTECIYGCYVHSAILPTFHRRCYWLLQNPDVVLVHYLNVPFADETKTYLPSMSFLADKLEWTADELMEQLSPMFSCPSTVTEDPTKKIRREQTLASLVEQLLSAQKSAVDAKSKKQTCGVCPELTKVIVTTSSQQSSTPLEFVMETSDVQPQPRPGCNHTKNRVITPKGATPPGSSGTSPPDLVSSVIPFALLPNSEGRRRALSAGFEDTPTRSNPGNSADDDVKPDRLREIESRNSIPDRLKTQKNQPQQQQQHQLQQQQQQHLLLLNSLIRLDDGRTGVDLDPTSGFVAGSGVPMATIARLAPVTLGDAARQPVDAARPPTDISELDPSSIAGLDPSMPTAFASAGGGVGSSRAASAAAAAEMGTSDRKSFDDVDSDRMQISPVDTSFLSLTRDEAFPGNGGVPVAEMLVKSPDAVFKMKSSDEIFEMKSPKEIFNMPAERESDSRTKSNVESSHIFPKLTRTLEEFGENTDESLKHRDCEDNLHGSKTSESHIEPSLPPTFFFNLSPSCPAEVENLDIEMFGDFPVIFSPDFNESKADSANFECDLGTPCAANFTTNRPFKSSDKSDNEIGDDSNYINMHVDNGKNDVANACMSREEFQTSRSDSDSQAVKPLFVNIIAVSPDKCCEEDTSVLMIIENKNIDENRLKGIKCRFGDLSVDTSLLQPNVLKFKTPRHNPGIVSLFLMSNDEVISNTVNFEFRERIKLNPLESPLSKSNWLAHYGFNFQTLQERILKYLESFWAIPIFSAILGNDDFGETFILDMIEKRAILVSHALYEITDKSQQVVIPSFDSKMSFLQALAALGMTKVIDLFLKWNKSHCNNLDFRIDLDPDYCGIFEENALMWACQYGHTDAAVLIYCSSLAAINKVSSDKQDAIEICRNSGHALTGMVLEYIKDVIACQQERSEISSIDKNTSGISSSSSAVFSLSSSFESCPSDRCNECSTIPCNHAKPDQGHKVSDELDLNKQKFVVSNSETSVAKPVFQSMPPPPPPRENDQHLPSHGGSSSGSESAETPASKAERRRIIMRRLIKRLSAKTKEGTIDIPGPPAGALPPRKSAGQESKSVGEGKVQGLKRQHEDRNSIQASPLSPEQIKIQQHVVQLSQLQQQQLQNQKLIQQQKPLSLKSMANNVLPKEAEYSSETESNTKKNSIHEQLQMLHQQIALQQKQMHEVQKQQHQLILQQQEMMKKSIDSGSPASKCIHAETEKLNDKAPKCLSQKDEGCFLAPTNPRPINIVSKLQHPILGTSCQTKVNKCNDSTKLKVISESSLLSTDSRPNYNPNPLNLPDHLYALRDDEGNCYQNNTDSNEEASVYTLASQIIDALPQHIKQQDAPVHPLSTADFRAKDVSDSMERNSSDIPHMGMIAPPPSSLRPHCFTGRFHCETNNPTNVPEVWRFGEPQLEEDSFPEYGANDGNFCFGTYRDVPGTPRSAYSSYSSSLSPASSLQSPASFATLEYEDVNPPSTAELNEFFTATSIGPCTSGLPAEDFSQLTLSDKEQRELYEAAKVIHSAYKKCGIESKETENAQSSQKKKESGGSKREIEAAVTIQTYFRRYKTFMYYRQMNEAATRIQAQFRAYSEHKRFRRSRDAAVLIQSQYRTYREHKQFLASKHAAVVIQQRYRSHYRKRKQQQQQQLQQQQQNLVTQSGAGPTSTSLLVGYAKGNGIHHYHPHLHHNHLSHNSMGSSIRPNLQANMISYSHHHPHQFHQNFPFSSTQSILPSNPVTAGSPFSQIVVQHQPSSQQQHYASSAQSTMAAATAAAAIAQCNFPPEQQNNLTTAAKMSKSAQSAREITDVNDKHFTTLSDFDLDSVTSLSSNNCLDSSAIDSIQDWADLTPSYSTEAPILEESKIDNISCANEVFNLSSNHRM